MPRRYYQLAILAVMVPVVLPQIVQADEPAAAAVELSVEIDRLIQLRLDAEKVPRAAEADDAEFLRRVYLDLHGVVPSMAATAEFLASSDARKRHELVDSLLADPRFGEHFGDIWRKYLISPLVNEQRSQTERFTAWMAERFNANDGWDQLAFDLLTATGKMEDNPAVTYLIEGRNPLGVTDLADLSSRYFLGVRLNCAQCHDHPFVDWKKNDYWGMAAFFAQIQTPNRPKMVYVAGLLDNPKMTMAVLRDADMIEGFQLQSPTFLGGDKLDPDSTEPHRVALARWMTSPENPYFAKAAVNRLWWHFFGRGLVDPVDDMHSGNAPSHPELLELLSRKFVESGFDVKHLCRAIVGSRTYQATSSPGDNAEREAELFARMSIKVLTAEQLYDSLVAILGPPGKTPSIDTRLGARHEFSQFFASSGDPEPTRYDRGIPHVLRLMNSPQFLGRNPAAIVSRVVENSGSSDQTIEQLYLAILSRRPTDAERSMLSERAARGSADELAAELAWALLMSGEFSLNH